MTDCVSGTTLNTVTMVTIAPSSHSRLDMAKNIVQEKSVRLAGMMRIEGGYSVSVLPRFLPAPTVGYSKLTA